MNAGSSLKSLEKSLTSSDPAERKRALYKCLDEREVSLLPKIREIALKELDEELAILATQVCLLIEQNPPLPEIEKEIEKALKDRTGTTRITVNGWKYLSKAGKTSTILQALEVISKLPPHESFDFIDSCLSHFNPQVREKACKAAIATMDPKLFVRVLTLTNDPDEEVALAAFRAVNFLPIQQLILLLDRALCADNPQINRTLAPFIPLLATPALEDWLKKVLEESKSLPIKQRTKEALAKIEQQKLKSYESPSQTLPPLVTEKKEKKSIEPPIIDLTSAKSSIEQSNPTLESTQKFSVPPQTHANPKLTVNSQGIQSNQSNITTSQKYKFTREEKPISLHQTSVSPNQLAQTTNLMHKTLSSSPNKPQPMISNVSSSISSQKHDNTSTQILASANEEKTQLQTNIQKVSDNIKSPSSTQDNRSKPETVTPTIIIETIETSVTTTPSQPIAQTSKQPTPSTIHKTQTVGSHNNVTGQKTQPPNTVSSPSIAIKENGTQSISSNIETSAPSTISVPQSPSFSKDLTTIPKPPIADSVLARYPSFLTSKIEKMFKPASLDDHFTNLKSCFESLLAFLNFTFMQTYLFFCQRNPKVDQTVMECLKANLVGPNGVRFTNQFSIVIKNVPGNTSFFTFLLARAFSEPSDQNPLFQLRELSEYIYQPIENLAETLPQAISAFPEILISFKSILQNRLIMKTKPGAREPFLDLTGPTPKPLGEGNPPALDLPPGEIVVLSRDATEALGLFPFFTFDGQKIVFEIPTPDKLAILKERLDLPIC